MFKDMNIREYATKVFYPFYFQEEEYKAIIDKYKNLEKWVRIDTEEVNKRKRELLPDVVKYLYSNSDDDVCIFKLDLKKVQSNTDNELEMFLNSFNEIRLANVSGNIKFTINNMEIVLFNDGIGIITFTVELGSAASRITSPEKILNFNKIFNIREDEKNNIEYKISDGSYNQTNMKKIMKSIVFECINGETISFYNKGFINYRYVQFHSYSDSKVFKDNTSDFMYYLMKFFNKRDSIEVLESFWESKVYMPQKNIGHFFSLKGGGVFVNEKNSSFITEGKFKENIFNNYSIALVVSLHQRLALLKMSKELTSAIGEYKKDHNKEIICKTDKILHKLRFFTAKSWFREFSNIEERNEVYKHWQLFFGIDRLFEDVRTQVNDINEYFRFFEYADKDNKRDSNNFFIGLITVIIIPMNAFIVFDTLNKNTSLKELIIITVISWLVSLLLYLGIKGISNLMYKKWRK